MTIVYGASLGNRSVFANLTTGGMGGGLTGAYTTTTGSTTTTIWNGWQAQTAMLAQQAVWNTWTQYPLPPPVQTLQAIQADEFRAREAAALAAYQEQVARQQGEDERRKAAYNRATVLLEGHLTPRQLDTFRRHKWFIVEGGKTKTRYAILTNSVTGNIYKLAKKRPVARMCCHADHGIPMPDQWLTQKLWLQYDEAGFCRIANSSRVESDYEYEEAA